MITKPEFSIVIPAYNEEEVLQSLFEALSAFAKGAKYTIQYVFVDDGSADRTYELLCTLELEHAQKKVVKLSRNCGSHAAIRAGIANADADYVMVYSSDMPEPIEDADLYYQYLLEGNELVYSVRKGYRGSLGSRIFAKLVNKYIEESYPAEGLIGIGIGPKMKAEVNRNIESNSSIFFQVFQLGFSRKAIEVQFNERESGSSKWTFSKKVKLFIDSFVMFSFAPIRAISIIGVVLALIGLVCALIIAIMKIFNVFAFAAGWPTFICVILIGFGITNVSLGIIAEYLVRTLDAARSRPVFVVDEVKRFEQQSSSGEDGR